MAEFDVFPDSELLAITIVRAADYSPLTVTVDEKLPTNVAFPAIVVHRFGGVPTERHRIDHPNLQFDVWADTKKQAQTVASKALQALLSAEGQTYDLSDDTTCFLSAVDTTLGLAWLQDPLNLKPRYTFSVAFTVHRI